MDEAGNLWVVGRRDDEIISGGQNVDPAEVEAVLRAQPGIAKACVVGRTDPTWGERVVAVVTSTDGTRIDTVALAAACRDQLAAFKVPKEILVWPMVPMSANGKVSRAQVRARLADATVPT